MPVDERYMRRAIELASHGESEVSPNPMVGAVIVAEDGRIIGEGYHRRCGEGHAEVNAVASVRDRAALCRATMYVTLEPCSHYGRTPPCAKLIIDCGIPRVVVGAGDPFRKVAGRGVAMLREAGVEVVTGVLADECRRLNMRFMTAHEQNRPFVTLKWAQSADGFMDCHRCRGEAAARFSTSLTRSLAHRLRSLHDAILVGAGTVIADNPRLDTRFWPCGREPRPVVLDAGGCVPADSVVMSRTPVIVRSEMEVSDLLHMLYGEESVTSLLVEGGAETLRRFIESGLWDVARIEIAPFTLGKAGSVKAPLIGMMPYKFERIDGNDIVSIRNWQAQG